VLSLGVTFYVKYLGSVLVDRSSGEDVTNQAIKTIITMVILASNLIEIQRIETATYSNMAYFPGEHFLCF